MSGEQVTLSMFEVTAGEWLYECDECGAVVRQGVTHTDWHQRGDVPRKRHVVMTAETFMHLLTASTGRRSAWNGSLRWWRRSRERS